jgi:hypothetical protein
MKLSSPRIERRIRRAVRRELKAAPGLWAERQRLMKGYRKEHKGGWVVRIIVLALFLGLLSKSAHDLMIAALSIASVGAAFFSARIFLAGLVDSPELGVLAHFPCSDAEYFSLRWRRALVASVWVPIFFGASYAGIAASAGGDVWAGLALALLQWPVLVTLGLAAAARANRWPLDRIGLGLLAAAVVLCIAWKYTAALAAETSWVNLLAGPPGWIGFAFRHGAIGGDRWLLSAAIPAGLSILLLPLYYRRLKGNYALREVVLAPGGVAEPMIEEAVSAEMARRREYEPEYVDAPPAKELERARLHGEIHELMVERIREGEFLRPHDWNGQGWLARLAERWLSPRQRLAAEVMVGEAPGWTGLWKTAALIAAIGVVLGLGGAPAWVQIVGMGLSTMIALPLFGGEWQGLRPSATGGQSSPLYGGYPVSFRDSFAIALKVNALRCAAWLPLACAQSVALYRHDPGAAILLTVKLMGLLVAAQPLFLVWKFAQAAGFIARSSLFSPRVLLAGLFVLAFAASAAAVLGAPLAGLETAGLAVCGAISWALAALFRMHHDRGRLDLLL